MTDWKLRILKGQHQGIEVPLTLGSLSIGADEAQDDIVLTDEGVHPQHAQLIITQDGVTLASSAESQLRIGQRLIEHPVDEELPATQNLMLGPLQFVVGKQEDDLTAFEPITENEQPKANKVKRFSTGTVLVLTLLLGCLPGALISWLWFNPSNSGTQSAYTANESLQEVRKTARYLKLDNVRAQWNDHSQQVLLEGYIDTKEQAVEFLNKIDQKGINYKSELRTMTVIKDGVRFVLDNLGYHQIRVSDGDTAGTVLLTGSIDDSSRWDQVERILETDVPGLVAWKVQLQKAGAYMETLKGLLDNKQLSDKVQLVEVADRIEVRGELTEKETNDFYDAAGEFREVWGDRPFIVLKSMPLVASSKGLTLPIRSISLGQVPYLILTDNVKYAEGSKLPSGHRVERISESSIDLIKGDIKLSIHLRGPQHAALN